ncbi:valine--tRNA ligase [Acidiferrimicrobium sp. IK]|uniref:valine--tRNA ligase n=1 Tax=Acidiferrimicrobium sp. IK TaxID=2871700 RepID=UPI0021CAF950|nr:valine--tRNA ligase [Acidiferrimicrobium sp. IK]MCU4186454.1 valine--tRNA ligase [Acidiferrimicrobium sp. IK]
MTAASTTRAGRSYQLPPPDRTGALLGLSHRAVATLAVGLVVGVLAFSNGDGPVGIAAAAVCVALVVARADGGPLIETLPTRLVFWWDHRLGRHRWRARLPLPIDAAAPAWPPALDGQALVAVGPDGHGIAGGGEIAVVWDRPAGTVSATVTVSGRHFGLVDPADQDAALARWGEALAGFIRERSPVAQVAWSEWAAPAGVGEHLAFIDRNCHDPHSPPAVDYRQLVSGSGPAAIRHEVAVTVSVQAGRTRSTPRSESGAGSGTGGRGGARKARAAAITALAGEVRLFSDRLAAGGLKVSAPWDVPTLCRAIRARLDPTVLAGMDRRSASLAAAAGMVRPADAGPLATETGWSWWRADGSVHRCFYVADWPRLAMPAGWMGPLLGWAGCVRSISVVMEPVGPRESAQAVRRAATKLDSDSEHRAGQGFRIGAALRRAQQAVAEREEELTSGYRELTYAGIVTITAPTLAELDRHSDDLIQVAGSGGVELRALHGRHDQAFAVSLPVGRGLTPPRRRGSR